VRGADVVYVHFTVVDEQPHRRPRVLLVEDDAPTRRLFTKVLSDAGCLVRAAANAEEALEIAADFHPAVVVMDLVLPETDGLDAMRLLRAEAGARNARFIACSAYTFPEIADRAYAAGCCAVVTKPCSGETLERAVMDCLRYAENDPPHDAGG
jgi:two-component system, cell cycle response regulator DivK